jgi:hypothetical protein
MQFDRMHERRMWERRKIHLERQPRNSAEDFVVVSNLVDNFVSADRGRPTSESTGLRHEPSGPALATSFFRAVVLRHSSIRRTRRHAPGAPVEDAHDLERQCAVGDPDSTKDIDTARCAMNKVRCTCRTASHAMQRMMPRRS